ncbi:hypothetical protein [Streptomyces sp. NPDC000134]|uniref:hypothetical protein n=1 Tax=Streptomyces sp. NPDC000134 TaxID=3364536 RepID=UPI0036C8481E
MSLGDEHTGQTRTRYPDGDGTPRRPSRSPSRSLVTVVGVVVLLIAAIAFANRGGDDSPTTTGTTDKPATSATAPSGERPADSRTSGVPTGYAHDEQGAQSAAANYATVLWSDRMLNTDERHQIVQVVAEPGALDRLRSDFDANYSSALLKNLGLKEDGSAPRGDTFVSRTLPVGTKVTAFQADAATVEVWCNSLFGLAGEDSTKPVTTGWFTVTFKLIWSGGDWRVREASQKTGPTPINGDTPVSGADEIGKAVKEFGGFTYAR